MVRALLVAGRDVEEDDLVGALARRSARPAPRDRPRRAGPTKLTPLTTRPSLHVEARDDPDHVGSRPEDVEGLGARVNRPS